MIPTTESKRSDDYYKLDRAVQDAGQAAAAGQADACRTSGRQTREREAPAALLPPFGKEPLNFAGLLPRDRRGRSMPDSPAKGAAACPATSSSRSIAADDPIDDPTVRRVHRQRSNRAGASRASRSSSTVLRDGKRRERRRLDKSTMKVDEDAYGLGFGPGYDAATTPVVAGVVADSPAAKAGIPPARRSPPSTAHRSRPGSTSSACSPRRPPVSRSKMQRDSSGDKPTTSQAAPRRRSRDAARHARYAIAPALALDEQIDVRKDEQPARRPPPGA